VREFERVRARERMEWILENEPFSIACLTYSGS
jgi:hypothetical protein